MVNISWCWKRMYAVYIRSYRTFAQAYMAISLIVLLSRPFSREDVLFNSDVIFRCLCDLHGKMVSPVRKVMFGEPDFLLGQSLVFHCSWFWLKKTEWPELGCWTWVTLGFAVLKKGGVYIPSLKLTLCSWKIVVWNLLSFWESLFSGAVAVSFREGSNSTSTPKYLGMTSHCLKSFTPEIMIDNNTSMKQASSSGRWIVIGLPRSISIQSHQIVYVCIIHPCITYDWPFPTLEGVWQYKRVKDTYT